MIDIEKILIGTLVLSEEKYPDVARLITAKDFVSPDAAVIYSTISEMYGKETVGIPSVFSRLKTERQQAWLLDATDDLIPAPVTQLARQIRDAAKRRRISAELAAILEKAKQDHELADDILFDLQQLYYREAGDEQKDCAIPGVVDRFIEVQARNRTDGDGLGTGFEYLDRNFVRYRPGHLWVIGAWTSVGKSALMIEAVNRLISRKPGAQVAIFSTEMTEETNVARLLANRTGYNAHVILAGKLIDAHERTVRDELGNLKKTGLHIYDQIRTIDGIATECRRMKMRSGLDVVFIDFIQNVEKRGCRSNYEMMSQVAIDLQNLAHEMRCTIVCLSQIPNHAGREDSGILEFKGAGEIAAACDIGVLMKRSLEQDNDLLFDIRKNRHGACKKYLLRYREGYTGLDELGEVVNGQ